MPVVHVEFQDTVRLLKVEHRRALVVHTKGKASIFRLLAKHHRSEVVLPRSCSLSSSVDDLQALPQTVAVLGDFLWRLQEDQLIFLGMRIRGRDVEDERRVIAFRRLVVHESGRREVRGRRKDVQVLGVGELLDDVPALLFDWVVDPPCCKHFCSGRHRFASAPTPDYFSFTPLVDLGHTSSL